MAICRQTRCCCVAGIILIAASLVAADSHTADPFNIPGITPLASSDVTTLGNGLWATASGTLNASPPPQFTPIAKTSLPLTVTAAKAAGWVRTSDTCLEKLGWKYSNGAGGPTSAHPLELFFTDAEQIAGTRVTAFGLGVAADNSLVVNNKFWLPSNVSGQWYMTMSFRAPDKMCNTPTTTLTAETTTLGDRLVINQEDIARTVPLTAAEAIKVGHQPGSCLKSMGQHFPYDLRTGQGKMSWDEGSLLPIVPMYYPPDITGTITGFFYAVPQAQSPTHGDWDNPPLTPTGMCGNFCTKNKPSGFAQCEWTKTSYWNTLHIYLNSQWSTIVCPGGDVTDPFTRTCPTGFVDNDAIGNGAPAGAVITIFAVAVVAILALSLA